MLREVPQHVLGCGRRRSEAAARAMGRVEGTAGGGWGVVEGHGPPERAACPARPIALARESLRFELEEHATVVCAAVVSGPVEVPFCVADHPGEGVAPIGPAREAV
jgi:hypothetical protein